MKYVRTIPTTKHFSPKHAVKALLRGRTSAHVVVGPLVHHPDGSLYFIVATCGKGFRCDQIAPGDMPGAELRREFIATLCGMRGPLVVHDMACELEMARLCESLWPGDKIKALRQSVEAERYGWTGTA